MSTALKELKRLLNHHALSTSDMINFMSQVRILIEENNFQSKYKFLNLYCNWTLHSKISGSIVCYKILEQLTDILLLQEATNKTIIHREISNIISIPGLRKNFIDLFNEFNLPVTMFTNRAIWKNTFGMIAFILFDRSLEFPPMKEILRKPKIKAIYDSIQNKSKGTFLAVRRFSFFVPDRKILHWKIEATKERAYIVGKVAFPIDS